MKYSKTYEAVGFVEALIAIMVAGIACVVLMGMATDTIMQISKTEMEDEMTQIAIEVGTKVKAIAGRNNNETTKYFPSITEGVNSCYTLSVDNQEPEFDTDGSGNFTVVCNYDAGERSSCKNSTVPGNTDLFGVFCITNKSSSANGLVVGKVIVGKKVCSNSEDCDISDYEYYVLTKTTQK